MRTIKNLSIVLMDKADPRYPDWSGFSARPTPSGVYLCTVELDDGNLLEAPFFTFDDKPMTPEFVGQMLNVFAAAIARAVERKQAA